jgi:hypothetical protein
MFGAEATWNLDRQLAASIVDLLAAGNWQRGGAKKKDKPKPVDRPGVNAKKRIGSAGSLKPAELRALLDSLKPLPPEED